MMIRTIQSLSRQFLHEITEIRRHLHQYPELSFQENNTMQFIAEKLKLWNILHQEGVAGTGIVAHIYGSESGTRTIALRADMDALPIMETNDVAYASVNSGVMHACGHDVHMACLLGAAKILAETRQHWQGTIRLLFQPGEESLPGGASLMIRDGALENPVPQAIFGQHVAAQLDVGKVGIRSGMYMASADEIYITVKGKGGHAAMPHMLADPVLIASHIVVALQQIVSRNNTPWIPSVLSFGKIEGNGRTNVIPSEVKLEGTFRTFNETWRVDAHNRIRQIAEGVAQSMGGKCEINIVKGYPYLENNTVLADNFRNLAAEYVGEENLVELDLSMTSEDFAWYSQQIPACFYRLGIRNESKSITSNIHTPTFNIDESALEIGMGLMAWIAINQLNS